MNVDMRTAAFIATLLCSGMLAGACAAERVVAAGERAEDAAQGQTRKSSEEADTRLPAGGTSGAGVSGSSGTSSTTGPLEGRRGSTPPGTDRAGGAPSSGAIVDPTGAATRDPVRQ